MGVEAQDDGVDVRIVPKAVNIVNLYCPSVEWEERASQILGIPGARVTIVYPEEYRDQHFPSGVNLGQEYEIYVMRYDVSVVPTAYLARLESIDNMKLWDVVDRDLKGVLGIQFVDPLIGWFDSNRFIEMLGIKDDRRVKISYDSYIDLVEFVISSPESRSLAE